MTITKGSGQFNPQTNASGTIIATAKPFGSAPAVNLANPQRNTDTICRYGPAWLTVATLVAMGVLTRNGATLTENYARNQGNRVNPTDPISFPL